MIIDKQAATRSSSNCNPIELQACIRDPENPRFSSLFTVSSRHAADVKATLISGVLWFCLRRSGRCSPPGQREARSEAERSKASKQGKQASKASEAKREEQDARASTHAWMRPFL
jgi:hypothetical protein